MGQSSIEVIIPVRNMADHLPKVLRPLLAQRADGDLVTVVNDASTDDTEAVARSLGANVLTVTNSQGPYYARQVAARRSAADIFLFVDARCRPLPGLLDAHRELLGNPGVALSCTDVRTLSGPTLAARVTALLDPFGLPCRGAVPGKPSYYPTANLGIDRTAFAKVGGFRRMRNGGDSDICWRIQEQALGTMAVDTRVLMEWEPRTTMRDVARQWKRYGRGTAYLRWVHRMESVANEPVPSPRATVESFSTESFKAKSSKTRRAALRRPMAEVAASCAIAAVFQLGYFSEKLKSAQFVMPAPFDVDTAEATN